MPRENHLRQLIINYNRRLEKLKEQQALYGISVDPKIPLEIEDIEAKIEALQAELEERENLTEPAKQTNISTSGHSREKPDEATGARLMDPATIATAAIAILSPYLAKAGEAAAEKAGEAAWEKAAAIYQAIKARFAKEEDDYSSRALERFEEKPESRKGTVQELLAEILAQDPDFARTLSHLLKEAEDAGAGTVFKTTVHGGEVGQIINIDKLEGGLTINKKN